MRAFIKIMAASALAVGLLEGCAASRDAAPARYEPPSDEDARSSPARGDSDSPDAEPRQVEEERLQVDDKPTPDAEQLDDAKPLDAVVEQPSVQDPKKAAPDAAKDGASVGPRQPEPAKDPEPTPNMKTPASQDRVPSLPQQEPTQTAPPADVGATEVTSGEARDFSVEGDVFVEEGADSPHGRVQALERAIAGYREDFGVEAPTERGGLSCEEVEDLKEGICGSSQKICKIAQEYPQEAWFAERCQWSQRQCEEAQGRSERCGR